MFFYLVNYDFIIIFHKEYTPDKKSEIENNLTEFLLKRLLLLRVEKFIERGYNFVHISEVYITSLGFNTNMTYQSSIKRTMSMLEFKIKLINDKNPYLINALDENTSHPIIRKFSFFPYANQNFFLV